MKMIRTFVALAFTASLVLGAAGCKDNVAPTMLANMGGMDGVSKLVQNWGAAMSANAELGKALSADDISMVGRGFVNEVAKASEIPMPNAGVDLLSVLKEKNLSKESLGAMGDALKAACGTTQLSPDATKGAMRLWGDVVGQIK